METQATLNVRLPETLKQRGGAVLDRAGVSASDAIRKLYAYMEARQDIPGFLKEDDVDARADQQAKRRNQLKDMVGILPSTASLDDAREARLAAKADRCSRPDTAGA